MKGDHVVLGRGHPILTRTVGICERCRAEVNQEVTESGYGPAICKGCGSVSPYALPVIAMTERDGKS